VLNAADCTLRSDRRYGVARKALAGRGVL